MNVDIEEIISRELREVASGLDVPARPPVPQERHRVRHLWRPLLVAAAMIGVAAGGVTVLVTYGDDGGAQQASSPPVETPGGDPAVRPLTADVPAVPFLFDGHLYVDGKQVSGTWSTVRQAGGTWVAERSDETWWWGTSAEHHAVPGTVVSPPRLSPDGALLAVATTTQDGEQALLIDARSGETVNAVQTASTEQGDSIPFTVVGVTNDMKVFLENDRRRLMWLAAEDDETVDLGGTAPDQWVRGNTSAGLIVFDGMSDGFDDAVYLAEASESGALDRLRTLPSEGVVVNPSGTWLAFGGTWGGEAETISEITAQQVDGSRQLALQPPDDRDLQAVTWEDDDLLLAELYTDGRPTGMARCSIREETCLVIDLL